MRDVWEKKNAGIVATAAGNFTAHWVPAQDSKLMLLTPSNQKHHNRRQLYTHLIPGFSVSTEV